MPLAHATATSNLRRDGVLTRANAQIKSENEGVAAIKANQESRIATRASRQALGTITNRATTATTAAAKQAVKPRSGTVRGPAKDAAPKALPKQVKPKREIKAEAPAVTVHEDEKPMDISAVSQSDAFSSRPIFNVPDIDSEDAANPQLVSIYVGDIYEYMRSLERKYAVRPNYLEGQDITARMRGVLVDWLVQVHLRFHLLQETLYLTVALVDRFLQEQSVSRNKLQLVGVTAMLLASKYEEMYSPEVKDFVYITDKAYSAKEIRQMEQIMLRTLGFNLGKPLPLHFLRRNSKAGEVDAITHTLAKYLMELTVVDYNMVHYNPSQIAAASLCLANMVLNDTKWTDTLHYYSHYSEEELRPLVQRLAKLACTASEGKNTAVATKYGSSKFSRISTHPSLKTDIVRELAAKAT